MQSTATSTILSKAQFVANEGLEASRNIRDAAFANLTDGNHGLAIAGGNWTFSGTTDTVDIFTRQVNISTIDANTKEVKVTLTWTPQFSAVSTLTQTMRLTNWQRSVSVIGNWGVPSIESSVNITGNVTAGRIKKGSNPNYVFIVTTANNNNFQTIDVTNTATPSSVANTLVPAVLNGLAVSGNFAYVTSNANTQEFTIINVTTPTAPTVAGFLDLANNTDALDVDVSGNFAYVLRTQNATDHEFNVINVTTPATPTLSGTLDFASSPTRVFIMGNFAYVASTDNSAELEVVNITNPASPTLAGTLNLAGNNDAISITGFTNRLVIGRVGGEVDVVDVTTPSTPSLLGSFAATIDVNDLTVGNSNTYAFLGEASSATEFQVINITNPASISLVGSLNMTGTLNAAYYDSTKDRVYVGSGFNPEFTIIKPN